MATSDFGLLYQRTEISSAFSSLLFSNLLHHKRSVTACILCNISLAVSGRQHWLWHIITSTAKPPAETSISPHRQKAI